MSTRKFIAKLADSLPSTLKSLSKNWNMEVAGSLVDTIESGVANPEKGYRKVLAPLIYCKRTLSGAIEGLDNDLVELSYVQKQVKKLVKTHCKDFVDLAGKELNKDVTPRMIVPPHSLTNIEHVEGTFKLGTNDAAEALSKMSKGLPSTGMGSIAVADIDDMDAEKSAANVVSDAIILERMAKARREVSRLPSTMSNLIELVQAPVVPIGSTFQMLSVKKLQIAGISAIVFLNYKIFEGQWLLAVNYGRMIEITNNINKEAGKTKITAAQYMVNYVNDMLAYMNKRLSDNEKFEIFSAKPVTRNNAPRIMYFWLMREVQMDAWRQAGLSGAKKLREWQFPEASALEPKSNAGKHDAAQYKAAEELINKFKRGDYTEEQVYAKYRRMMYDTFGVTVENSLMHQDIFKEIWRQKLKEDAPKQTITKKVAVTKPKKDEPKPANGVTKLSGAKSLKVKK